MDVIGVLILLDLVLVPTIRSSRHRPWAPVARVLAAAIGVTALGVAGLMAAAVTDPEQDSPDALYVGCRAGSSRG